MSEADCLSYDSLKAYAFTGSPSLHCDVHKSYRSELSPPGRVDAYWYLMYSRKVHPEMTTRELTILTFATATEVYDKIVELRKAESSK